MAGDVASALSYAVRQCVVDLAEFCCIDIWVPTIAMRLVEIAHRNPVTEAAVKSYHDLSTGTALPPALEEVMQRNQPAILDPLTPEILARLVRSPRHQRWLMHSRATSAVILPVPGKMGALGTVQLIRFGGAAAFTAEDVEKAERSIACAATVVDNVRLFREAQLAESRFRSLTEASDQGILITDLQERVEFTNIRFAELCGCSAEDLAGRVVDDLVVPADREALGECLSAKGIGCDEYVEVRLRAADGKEIPTRVRVAQMVRGGAVTGSLLLFSPLGQDAGAREGVPLEVEAARHIELHLGILREVAAAFAASARDLTSVLDLIARRLSQVVGDLCSFRLLSEDGNWLDSVALDHSHREGLANLQRVVYERRLSASEPPWGKVVATGRPVVAGFGSEDLPAVRERFNLGEDYRAVVIVPVRSGDRVLGTLGLARLGMSTKPFSEADIILVQSLADQAGMAIDNARLVAKLKSAAAS